MKNRFLMHMVVYLCEDGTVIVDDETTACHFGGQEIYDTQNGKWLSMDEVPDESKDHLIEAFDNFVTLIGEDPVVVTKVGQSKTPSIILTKTFVPSTVWRRP